MKLQFKHQKFQADAARAVCDVFTGQPFATHSYMVDPGKAVNGQGELFKESGFANVLLLNILPRGHQMLGLAGDLVVNVVAQAVPVVADAIEKGDAHGDGADVQILLPDHLDGFQYISCI